jgi:uncharacterized protein with PIN domain
MKVGPSAETLEQVEDSFPDRSSLRCSVCGSPLFAVRIPVSCQPPRAAMKALFPRGDGIIQTEEMARMWVRSVHQLPAQVALLHDEFLRCPDCGRAYWKGGHFRACGN